MQVLVCDGTWSISAGSATCSGTLVSVDAADIPSGMTLEDAKALANETMILFAIVFGFLALKKALN